MGQSPTKSMNIKAISYNSNLLMFKVRTFIMSPLHEGGEGGGGILFLVRIPSASA